MKQIVRVAGEKTGKKQRRISNPRGNPETLAPAWGKGQSGNPAGRPKGSRNAFGEAFIADMQKAWEEGGPDVIKRVMDEDPAAFLRSAVAILPKQMDVTVNKYEQFDEQQLKHAFASALNEARKLGIVDNEPGAAGRADPASEAEPTGKIQTLQ